jgi:hypothetical protein
MTEPSRDESHEGFQQMPSDRRDFFISYTGADEPWAEWIAFELEGASYTTRIQAWDFHAGSNFVMHMQRALAGQ